MYISVAFMFVGKMLKMKDRKEGGSVSDRLDALLLSILKEAKEYEENKLKFMEIFRDVPLALPE